MLKDNTSTVNRSSAFDYRSFYTWDHSTNWDLSQPGHRVSGCNDPYDKPSGAFVEDYRRLIDYMSGLGLNHLIIWGALRDSHGGVESLRTLVEHGKQRGVRVAPGVGVNCYGGAYYEGDHEFSLERLLRKHPEYAAIDANGNTRKAVACPRKAEVIEWNQASMRWLMETAAPKAIHFETGDYGLCHCEICASAGDRSYPASNEDMAEVLPPIFAQVKEYDKDCWLSYNHYTGYSREMMENPPAFARRIPEDAICKWGVSWMLEPEIYALQKRHWEPPELMNPDIRPPTKVNMAHLHYGTGWWGCSPRGTLEISRFLRYIPLVKRVGFQGLCTHGEDSSLVPASELNYHVFAALAENALATPEQIVARSVGQLLGDDKLALAVLTAYKERRVPRSLLPDVAGAVEKAEGQQKVRLNWLTFDLHRFSDQLRRRELGR